MASAPVPLTNVRSGYSVVTQVVQSSSSPTTAQQNSSKTLSPLKKFLKGEPKALGLFILVGCAPNTMLHIQNMKNRAFTSSLISTLTCAAVTRQSATVQIMIGVLTILLGVVTVFHPMTLGVFSGVVFWASLFHISAGSLAVAASNKLNSCVVKATMALDIFSTIAAGISIIFFCLDLTVGPMQGYCQYNSLSSHERDEKCTRVAVSHTKGITGVLLAFSLLQFIISITVAAFTCEATCTNEPTLNIINVVPNPDQHIPVGCSFPAYQPQPNVSTLNAAPQNGPPVENPPAYCEKNQPVHSGLF